MELVVIVVVSNVERRGSRHMYDDARNARVGARHAKIDLRSLPTESENAIWDTRIFVSREKMPIYQCRGDSRLIRVDDG